MNFMKVEKVKKIFAKFIICRLGRLKMPFFTLNSLPNAHSI